MLNQSPQEDKATTRRRKDYYRRIHTHLRALDVTAETEQRNIFNLATGIRSLKEMSESQLHELSAFLCNQREDTKVARVNTNPSADYLEALLA